MTSRVVFVVPADAGDVARSILAHGGRGEGIPAGVPESILAPAMAGMARERREVRFEGWSGVAGAEALCLALDEARAPYVCVVEGRVDPSMCMPEPGRVAAYLPRLAGEPTVGRLPLGFENAGLDARTFAAAGMDHPARMLEAVVPEGPDGWADAAERSPRPVAEAGYEDAAA